MRPTPYLPGPQNTCQLGWECAGAGISGWHGWGHPALHPGLTRYLFFRNLGKSGLRVSCLGLGECGGPLTTKGQGCRRAGPAQQDQGWG